MTKPTQYAAEMKEPVTVDQLIGILQGLRAGLGGSALVHINIGGRVTYDVIGFKTTGHRTSIKDDFTNAVSLEGGHF